MSKHLAKIQETTSANILSIGAANQAVPTQFYYSLDTEQFFYGKKDGSMSNPFPNSDGGLVDFQISDGFNIQQFDGSSPMSFKPKSDSLLNVELKAGGLFEFSFNTAGATDNMVPTFENGAIVWKLNSNGTVRSVLDTPTIDLNIGVGGVLSSNLNTSAAGDNILQLIGDGAYVKDLGIAAGSAGLLGYNTATRELSINPLNTVQYKVGTQTTIAAWVSTNYITGAEYGESDIVTLPNGISGIETWINNGGIANDITDWTLATPTNFNTATVRGLFSGASGVIYNSNTGVFSADLSVITDNDLTLSGNSLFLDVSESDVTDTVGIGGDSAGTTKTLQSMLDDLAASNGSFSFNFADNNGDLIPISGGVNFDFVGGDLLKTTRVFGATNKMIIEINLEGGTPGDLIGINSQGDGVEWVNTNGSGFIFKNGVKLLNNEVFLGGVLNNPVIIDTNANDFILAGLGTLKVGGTLELISTNSKVVMRSASGQKWQLIVDDGGFISSTAV